MGLFSGKAKEPIKTVKPSDARAKSKRSDHARDESAAVAEVNNPDGVFQRQKAESERKNAAVTAGMTVNYAVTDRRSVKALVFCTHADGTVDLEYFDRAESPKLYVKRDVAGSDGSVTGTWYIE